MGWRSRVAVGTLYYAATSAKALAHSTSMGVLFAITPYQPLLHTVSDFVGLFLNAIEPCAFLSFTARIITNTPKPRQQRLSAV